MGDQYHIIVLVRDLMFSSRISATARAENASIKFVRNLNDLIGEAGQRLIVDLNEAGNIEAAVQWKQAHAGEVVGFVSHVDKATIDRAREAGIERILPRSQFVQMLPDMLRA